MYTTTERISASKTGVSGRLKLTEAMNMLQDCSLLWLESEPSLHSYLQANHLMLLVISRQIDIIRLPAYKETVTIRTGIFDCKSLMGFRNSVMVDEQQNPCLLTWGTGILIHRETQEIARFPKTEIAKLVMDARVEMDYLDRRIDCPADKGISLPSVPVRRNDIDFFNHMNNVKYIEAALELIPDGLSFNRLRIEYKNSAKPGDLLYPLLAGNGGKVCLILADKGGHPYTVMEFSE